MEVGHFNTGPPIWRVPPGRRFRRSPLTRCLVTLLNHKSSLGSRRLLAPDQPPQGNWDGTTRLSLFGPATKAKRPPGWNRFSAFDSSQDENRTRELITSAQRGKFLKPPDTPTGIAMVLSTRASENRTRQRFDNSRRAARKKVEYGHDWGQAPCALPPIGRATDRATRSPPARGRT